MIEYRKRASGLGLLVSLAFVLAACASGPTIITNSDPSADFMSMKTFAFMQPLSTDRGSVQSLLSTQMIEATSAELEQRGWRLADSNPDVVINFHFDTKEQIRSRNTSTSVSMHRGGRYGMWGGTMATPTIEQVTQGALSIDIVDPKRNQLIWEGTATNRITESIRRNQAESVRNFVAAIFAEFP